MALISMFVKELPYCQIQEQKQKFTDYIVSICVLKPVCVVNSSRKIINLLKMPLLYLSPDVESCISSGEPVNKFPIFC